MASRGRYYTDYKMPRHCAVGRRWGSRLRLKRHLSRSGAADYVALLAYIDAITRMVDDAAQCGWVPKPPCRDPAAPNSAHAFPASTGQAYRRPEQRRISSISPPMTPRILRYPVKRATFGCDHIRTRGAISMC